MTSKIPKDGAPTHARARRCFFDLDVLRGWREYREDELDAAHQVAPLAALVTRDADGSVRTKFSVHGPEVYIGRYHPQHGPVDLMLTGFLDYEVYAFSAPHIRLSMSKQGEWRVRPMTPSAKTAINDSKLEDTGARYPITDGDVLRLGVVEFEFQRTGLSYEGWKASQKAMLLDVERPSLFLIRAGAVCGPRFLLNPDESTILGRSFPGRAEAPSQSWRIEGSIDWDLSALPDHERKFVGFRHCEFWCEGEDDWYIKPISTRQRTYVNRIEISGTTPLMPGDEVGLGSVLLHFHHPSNFDASTDRRTVELPTIVDWKQSPTRLEKRVETDTEDNS